MNVSEQISRDFVIAPLNKTANESIANRGFLKFP